MQGTLSADLQCIVQMQHRGREYIYNKVRADPELEFSRGNLILTPI